MYKYAPFQLQNIVHILDCLLQITYAKVKSVPCFATILSTIRPANSLKNGLASWANQFSNLLAPPKMISPILNVLFFQGKNGIAPWAN